MEDFPTLLSSQDSSPKRRHTRTTSFASRDSSQSLASRAARARTPSSIHRPTSAGIRSNASDTDHSDIVAPVPRRHFTLQRSESQHWLGSPPLSPVSAVSRTISPLSHVSLSPTYTRKRHTSSFTAVMDSERRHATLSPSLSRPVAVTELKAAEDSGMARRWTRWMHKQGLKHRVIPLIFIVSALVKWCIGLGSYSGAGAPPLYGDYEAQRHWMELTTHLPVLQWYSYDLNYWGLDYPPLTAYHSWLCGIIGSWINPSWFALDKSRGIETKDSKIFLRATVLASDTLIYVPAAISFTYIWQRNRSLKTQHVALLRLLFQPSLLLIDFGHFQYNAVMLGLTLLSISFFGAGHDLLGAICFVLSLGFKQMALYYAPAVGSYLIAKCLSLGVHEGIRLFLRLAAVTVLSFIALFLPFIPPLAPLSAILQPLSRIFPFQRGLFEDKVANFWCASNVIIKWRLWINTTSLIRLSAAATAIGFLPSVAAMIYSGYKLAPSTGKSKRDVLTSSHPAPVLPLLPYALLTSSMSFFLFSFQVHEKTILLPLLPLTLLLSGASANSFTFQLAALVNNVAVLSMWPLLKRDGLAVQYVAMTLLWNKLIGYNPFRLQHKSLVEYISATICAVGVVLHITEGIVSPPARLPDIYPVLNLLLCTPVFVFTWLWSIKRSVEVSWGLTGLGTSPKASSATPATDIADGPVTDHDGDGLAEAPVDGLSSSLGLSVTSERPANLRTRSLGYAQGRKSSLRGSGSLENEQSS